VDKSIAKVKMEQEERNKRINQFEEMMAQAEELESKQKFEAAINLYETAADLNPDSEMPISNEWVDQENQRIGTGWTGKTRKQEQFAALMADAKKPKKQRITTMPRIPFFRQQNFYPKKTDLRSASRP